jgi:tetratricopeptide (TPR) repeat protein
MCLVGSVVALVLGVCGAGATPDEQLERVLANRDPNQDLAAAERTLADCAAGSGSTERRASAESYRAAVAQVREVERTVQLVYPSGGKATAEAMLAQAAAAVAAYPQLLARLAADGRAMERTDAVAGHADAEQWPEVARLAGPTLADPAVLRVTDAGQRAALEEARRRAERETGLAARAVAWATPAGSLLLQLLATFALVAGSLALTRAAARGGKRPRYDVALFDHEQDGSVADDALKGRLLAELRLLTHGTSVTAERAAELGTVAVVRSPGADEQLREIAARLDPAAIVGIGVLRVPLGVLWLWMVRAVYPPRFVWRGDLYRRGGETRIELEITDRRQRRPRKLSAAARGVDDDAVASAIRQLAYRIVHADLKDPPTRSAEAFAGFEEAHALLGAGEALPRAAMEQARELLERAVAEDPGFFAARLRLASVAARLGEVDLAVAMIEQLRKDPAAAERAELRYEEARIHAGYQDFGRVRRALRLVDELLGTAGLTAAVELNARSLRATIAAALLGIIERDEDDAQDGKVEADRLEGILEAELRFFDAPPPPRMDRKAFGLAGALARAAHGNHLIAAGRARGALPVLRAVVVEHPELLAAQLGLARAYREAKPLGWFDQARFCLERAERLAPESEAVHYEFGSALLARAPPEVESARAHLEKATRSPSALYKLGVLLAEEQREPAEGVRRIFRAIQARGRSAPPYWSEHLVRIVQGARLHDREALELAELAVRELLDCTRDAGKAAPRDPDADPGAQRAERRRVRRYLIRATDRLAEAVAAMPDEAVAAVAVEVRAIVKLLREVEQLVAEDRKANLLDPKDDARGATAARHRGEIERLLERAAGRDRAADAER